MRLDHLLSREKAEAETRKLIPRSMRERSGNAAHSSKEAVPKTARKLKERVKHRSGGLTRTHSVKETVRVESASEKSVSFSGFGKPKT